MRGVAGGGPAPRGRGCEDWLGRWAEDEGEDGEDEEEQEGDEYVDWGAEELGLDSWVPWESHSCLTPPLAPPSSASPPPDPPELQPEVEGFWVEELTPFSVREPGEERGEEGNHRNGGD